MAETKEKLKTPMESPVGGFVNTSERLSGGGGNSTKGATSAKHNDSGRCEWAKNRGETINSPQGKKVQSAHDTMMARPFDCGGNYAPEKPEKHDSKMVGKQLSEAESMGSNRPAPCGGGNLPSDSKLRVPNFRKA